MPRPSRIASRFSVVLLSLCAGATLGAEPVLKDGDRVLFIGDNATLQFYYSRMVENYFTLRHPGARIHFDNIGWTDTAFTHLDRLERDLQCFRPTVVTICYGMNDGGFAPLDDDHREKFRKGMTGLVDGFKKAGVKVILLTPNCVDPDRDKLSRIKKENWTYNETLAQLSKEVVKLAAEKKVPVFDVFSLMLDVQTRGRKDDPKFTVIPDGIYPDLAGHAVIAYGLLKALGCTEPASGLEVDAGTQKAKADRCKVEELKVTDAEISFTRTDAALPTVFADAEPVFRHIPLIEDFNQYRFKVTGLKASTWKLVVEGVETGTFSNAELAAGLNLATRPGPWQTMASQVDGLTGQEQGAGCQRWVYLAQYVPADELKPGYEACMKKVDAYLDTFQEKRIHAADARRWKWTLTAVAAKN